MANYTDIFPSTVTLETEVGDVTTLTTTEQGSTVGAVNELDAEIGADALTTTATTLSGAINELDAEMIRAYGGLSDAIDDVTLTASLTTVVYFTNYATTSVNDGFTADPITGIINVPDAGTYEIIVWVIADLDATKDVNVYLTMETNDGTTTTTAIGDVNYIAGAGQVKAVWKATGFVVIPTGTLDVSGGVGTGTNVRIGLSADKAVPYTNLEATFVVKAI